MSDTHSPVTEERPPSESTSDANVRALTAELFSKTRTYVQAELELGLSDYRLLEQMNRQTAAKYAEVRSVADDLSKSLTDLEVNYSRVAPFLDKIDVLETKVARLEELAYSVDNYSKRLEHRLKSLDKK